MWTSRSDAPMLVFVEQLLVASGQIVEHKRRRDWNGPVAGLIGRWRASGAVPTT
jgi:hypothetical protein